MLPEKADNKLSKFYHLIAELLKKTALPVLCPVRLHQRPG